MKTYVNIISSLLLLFFCIGNSLASDWPQYLGPNRNSTSSEKGIFSDLAATYFILLLLIPKRL